MNHKATKINKHLSRDLQDLAKVFFLVLHEKWYLESAAIIEDYKRFYVLYRGSFGGDAFLMQVNELQNNQHPTNH